MLHGAMPRCGRLRWARAGCIRDPDHDRHRCRGEISDKMREAAADAARHLTANGYLPLFDAPTLRELWRSGYADLVDELRGGGW